MPVSKEISLFAAKRILIVEDELIVAYDLADNLSQLGYTTTAIVDTGEAAIAEVAKNPPDCILMDIKLRGEISGIATAEALRDRHIPVIFLTAFSDELTIQHAARTNPYGYLTKPPRLEDVKATIATALARRAEDVKQEALLAAEQHLNQLRSRFLATAAHDLRQPISALTFSLDILQNYQHKLDPVKKDRQFQLARKAVAQMTQLLEDLLTGDRVESGKLRFNPKPMNAIAFCRDLIADFLTDRHRIVFTSQGDGSQVHLDETLLRYMLNNLISNALKYSSEEHPVDVHLTCKPNEAIFQVRDRGIGIPAEALPKLFEPFERADNVGGIKGTGLGLYIVKQAVEQHQGNIHIASQLGIGTTATITLPSIDTRYICP